MKKIAFLLTVLMCISVMLAACGGAAQTPETEASCDHQWEEGSCYTPKNCVLCGVTEGGPVHDYVIEESESVLPNCVDSGYYQYYCAICDDPHMEDVPATGHAVSEGVCVECGETVTE